MQAKRLLSANRAKKYKASLGSAATVSRVGNHFSLFIWPCRVDALVPLSAVEKPCLETPEWNPKKEVDNGGEPGKPQWGHLFSYFPD